MSREITMKAFCLFEQSDTFKNKNKRRKNDNNHTVTNTAQHKRQRKFQHPRWCFLGALSKFADELNAFGKSAVKEVGEAAKQNVDELVKSDEILGEVKIKIHALPRNSARCAKQIELCKRWKFRQWTSSL